LVAELAEDVVAAFEQLAGERDARTVPDPLGCLQVVRAVGAGREAGALSGLIERPAQRRWALAGEMTGCAVRVGLVDGDVQARVADDVPGVLLGAVQDRHEMAPSRRSRW
jgi:hypothetical protein